MDGKYFARAKLTDIQEEIKHPFKQRSALKRIVANITMGNEMGGLHEQVLPCLALPYQDIRKMAYFYLTSYSKSRPDLMATAIGDLVKQVNDANPLMRSFAVRTAGYLPIDENDSKFLLTCCLKEKDAFVAKTFAILIAKLHFSETMFKQENEFLDALKQLLDHDNANVI